MTTAAVTARNIRLIVETTIASHASIACHVEHNNEGTPPHQCFRLLISVEFACEVFFHLTEYNIVHYPCVLYSV